MSPSIDPASITSENVPAVLGSILTTLEALKDDMQELKAEQKANSECLQVFKISKCTILPWLSRNRYAVAIFFSLCVSSDILARWVQWTFFPPGIGP